MKRIATVICLFTVACATTGVPTVAPRPAPVAEAAPAPATRPPATLSLDDVLRFSSGAPVNRAARAAIERASGNLDQAGLAPNPVLRVSVERFDTNDLGDGPRKFTVRAYQRLETAGKRSKRSEVADYGVREAEWAERIVNISVARSAAGAHQEIVAADRLIALALESIATANELLDLSEAMVTAGREKANVLPALRARVGRLNVKLEDLRARRIRALHDLAGVLSLEPGSVTAVTGELLMPADLPEGSPTDNPEIALRAAEAETARAKTRSAGSKAYPDVTVGFGYEGDNPKRADDVHSVGFFFEVPLPFFDRNQGEVRESVAAVRRSEELTAAERARVAAEYALTLDLIRSGTANRKTWRERIVPALALDSELRKKEFEAGRTDRTALLFARLAELDATAAAVEVEARLAALVLDALALLGRPPMGWTN